MQDGKYVFVKLGGVVVSGLTDNSFAYAVDTFPVTTKDSDGHREYQAGEDGATISFSGLNDPTGTLSAHDIQVQAAAKTAVPVIYGAVTAGSKILSGSGIITKLDMTDPQNEASGFSGEILITGAITPGVVSDATLPVLESAAVNNASPTILRLTFSESLDPAYSVAGTAWAAAGSVSGAKTVTSTSIVKNKITLTMNEAYETTDVITVAYTAPGGAQDIRDLSGNLLASFTAEAVTNNITA